jgi:S1-C subfamily serine protease
MGAPSNEPGVQMNSDREPLPLADAVERVAASVVGLATRRQRSAGLLWRAGVAVGNASALWRASGVAVVLPDGEQVDGTVRGIDGSTDLAVVSFADRGAPAVARDLDVGVRVGDAVFAVGREPSGQLQASFGHIGAVAGPWRTWRGGRVERLIRLDGGLYPGLAGAAVGDASGRVLGVASAAFSRHHGVVLPVATIERVVEQLLTHGRVQQGYLGIAAQPVRAMRDGVGVDGLLVSSVADDGPAARAGLLVGDVIVALAGQPVTSLEGLRERLQVGTQVEVGIARGGRADTVSLQVAERPHSRCG